MSLSNRLFVVLFILFCCSCAGKQGEVRVYKGSCIVPEQWRELYTVITICRDGQTYQIEEYNFPSRLYKNMNREEYGVWEQTSDTLHLIPHWEILFDSGQPRINDLLQDNHFSNFSNGEKYLVLHKGSLSGIRSERKSDDLLVMDNYYSENDCFKRMRR